MNWLAHVFLSTENVEYQIGNLLADPLKGKAWEGASQYILDGMNMHKAIDVFTDAHKVVSQSKFGLKERGYLKGVVIDVLYDHYLSKNWKIYSKVELSDFLFNFYTGATNLVGSLPDEPRKFIESIVNSNRLSYYSHFEGVVGALERVEARLSPRIKSKESAVSYLQAIESSYDDLESDFHLFFPDLLEYFKKHELGVSTCAHQV